MVCLVFIKECTLKEKEAQISGDNEIEPSEDLGVKGVGYHEKNDVLTGTERNIVEYLLEKPSQCYAFYTESILFFLIGIKCLFRSS